MDWLIPLITLTSLEIVLGLDNVIFLSILVSKLPNKNQQSARQLGLFFAMFTRIALLLSLAWVSHLTKPFINLFHYDLTGRQLILVLGGLFLIAKSTHEIHQAFERAIAPKPQNPKTPKPPGRYVN
jgi:predicted tellurium resistance membrane protein TerC